MTNTFSVSINPSYFCNFRCDFCYLTPEQLGDQKRIEPKKLDQLLSQIPQIDHVDLYGGEIGALKKDYYYDIKSVIRKHYNGYININTNFSMLEDRFFEDDITLSVSYDFSAREKANLVFQNMLMSPVPLSVLILASPQVLQMNVDYMIQQLNFCKSVESVEIKPYSINQANSHMVTHREFELFVSQWIESSVKKEFHFENLSRIERSVNKQYNAWSDDHIYITPNGKFAVLEFDEYDKEYFMEIPSYAAYEQWAWREKKILSPICQNCNYVGHCLTEHYRYVKDLKYSCNGYINLLARYATSFT